MKTIVYNETEQVLFCADTSEPVVNVIDVDPDVVNVVVTLVKGGGNLGMVDWYLRNVSNLLHSDYEAIVEGLRDHNEALKKWNVPVTRISYAHNAIQVMARTEQEAIQKADEEAGDLSFSENASKYEFPEGATEIE